MKIELVKTSSTVGESNYHFQFTPAYRRNIFENTRVRKLVRAYMLSKAEELNIIISALDFGRDHMHVFVANCKKYSVESIARRLKGFISYVMRKYHWDLFEDKLYGKKFWTEGYFYRSVGAITSDSVEYYTAHSQKKHWEIVDFEFYKANEQRTLSDFRSTGY